MVPPLAVDVDGTITRRDKSIDPRVFDHLRAWSAPVVIATGKSFPYPIALCEFLGIELNVVAENGGVVFVEVADAIVFDGDPAGARAVAEDYREEGFDLGWGAVDVVNRWRETELAVARDRPREPLDRIAARHGMTVVDTGYAYHVKSPNVSKATGLTTVAGQLGLDVSTFAMVGDSANDAAAFGVVGHAIAVENADEQAKQAADVVTEEAFADGFLEALETLED